MTKTKQRLLSLTLVIAMFFALAIPASARASDYIARLQYMKKSKTEAINRSIPTQKRKTPI